MKNFLLLIFCFPFLNVSAQTDSVSGRLFVADTAVVVSVGDTILLPVKMDNVQVVMGLQCILQLPEGLKAVNKPDGNPDVSATSRGISQNVITRYRQDGSISLLCFSMSSRPFGGQGGDALLIPLVVAEDGMEKALDIRLKEVIVSVVKDQHNVSERWSDQVSHIQIKKR